MKKKDVYKVVVVKNGKIHKVFKKYVNLKHARKRFKKEKLLNELVVYPKQIVNTKGLKRVKYELLLLKKINKNYLEEPYINEFGHKVKKIIKGGWKILNSYPYNIEETFYVYGVKSRLTVSQILKKVFQKRIIEIYTVVQVFNKLVLYSKDDIEVILCKNKNECEKLHNCLRDFFLDRDVINFLFFGLANYKTRKKLYNRMQKHTGLKRQELFRTSTRS